MMVFRLIVPIDFVYFLGLSRPSLFPQHHLVHELHVGFSFELLLLRRSVVVGSYLYVALDILITILTGCPRKRTTYSIVV
jgi:hypothetical protein